MIIYILCIYTYKLWEVGVGVASNKKRIMISLTEEQNKDLENLAKERGFTKSAIVAIAIEEYKKGQKNA